MVSEEDAVALSKFLNLVLRHKPQIIGLTPDGTADGSLNNVPPKYIISYQ